MKLHIGIDDTDSKKGLCTTYLGVVLTDRLKGFAEVSEIRLVRLNPNIPWKTRGNGAVALAVETSDPSRVVEEALRAVEKYSAMEEEGTNPGLVVLRGEVTSELVSFYYKALRDIATVEEAEALAERHYCEVYKFNNGRGIIGALSAIGADLFTHTYELIAYRRQENWGTERGIEPRSVFEMDRATYPDTFNNVDKETSRILITPRSPCPVLFGIRARRREVLECAKAMLRLHEPIERYAVFKTNQGTDAHLVPRKISEVKPFTSAIVKGAVTEAPKTLIGGHVVFTIAENNSAIDCAAFEPTGSFRDVVKHLMVGDVVEAYGGVKETKRLTVNLEKLRVVELKEGYEAKNPVCPQCMRRMESAGKNQGFRCRVCKTTSPVKEFIPVKRKLKTGLYAVPTRAMRHLSMPLIETGGRP